MNIKTCFSALLSALLMLAAGTSSAASDLPREVIVNGVEFVHVPGGWFWYPVEGAQREGAVFVPNNKWYRDVKVWQDGFYIGKFEARARDFQRFMNAGKPQHAVQYTTAKGNDEGCAVRLDGNGYFLTRPQEDLPVSHMSWDLSVEFARFMGFRLPTEAEWVKAARGEDKRVWPWGNEHPDDTFAGYNRMPDCHLVPVDSFHNGRSPYGAYNMAGNVYEWVADWYNEQFDAALKDGDRNPKLADKSSLNPPEKLLKGGRWASDAGGISIYERLTNPADGGFTCFGLRFAVDESTVREHLAKGTATVVAQ
ncbi:formylglycine-generating enzyme family protein [Noviherbaspirillum sp. ST9]|uniref:formylglycine-generating enzyme family protein n=1 Tax=Noviherbaspirillum sp. ST9 TaxID=3401606 RepID=UPI003B585F7E